MEGSPWSPALLEAMEKGCSHNRRLREAKSTLPHHPARSLVIQKFSGFLKKLYENLLFKKIMNLTDAVNVLLFLRSLFALLLSVCTL